MIGLYGRTDSGVLESQWIQHWKFREAKRKQQSQLASSAAVGGRSAASRQAAKEGKLACLGIGRWHPKGAYNC